MTESTEALQNLGVLPVKIEVVDIAAAARELYGGADQANFIAGRTLPEHEYRFRITWPSGTEESCPAGWTLTADMIAAGIADSRSWASTHKLTTTEGNDPS